MRTTIMLGVVAFALLGCVERYNDVEDTTGALDLSSDAASDGTDVSGCNLQTPDEVGDGIDQNCDGIDGVDLDQDGFASIASGGDDCDDENGDVHPGATDFVNGVCEKTELSVNVEIVEQESEQCAYPAATMTSDGTLYAAYRATTDDQHVMLARRKPGETDWERLSIYHSSGDIRRIYIVAYKQKLNVVFHDIVNNRILCMTADVSNINPEGWTSYVVAQGQDGLLGKAIYAAVDDYGYIHVSYWDERLNDLMYAHNISGEFISEIVAGKDVYNNSEEGVGNHCVIGVDSKGNVRIAAYNETFKRLEYFSKDIGSNWESEIVDDESADMGTHIGIFIDNNDNTHLSYRDEAKRDLYYAAKNGQVWKRELVDGGAWVGAYSSVVVDSFGVVNVVYLEHLKMIGQDVSYSKMAVKSDGRWTISILSMEYFSGVEHGVLIDKNNVVNVFTSHNKQANLLHFEATLACSAYDVYGDSDCDRVDGVDLDGDGYASVASGGTDCDDGDATVKPDWFTAFALDEAENVGESSAMALDASNTIHVAYHSIENLSLQYFSRTSSGVITREVIDDSNEEVGSKGIALVPSQKRTEATATSPEVIEDRVHVAYYNAARRALYYAMRYEGVWTRQLVDDPDDTSSDVGMNASIGVDSDSCVHILYRDKVAGKLKYATNRTGSWVSMTVPTEGGAGENSALVVRKKGVYVAYRDEGSYGVKFLSATVPVETEEDWGEAQLVDGNGGGDALSLGVDSDGSAHISYRDSKKMLRYALQKDDGWEIFGIQSGTDVDTGARMAVDEDGFVHVVYRDSKLGCLKYAWNSREAKGEWLVEEVKGKGESLCGGLIQECGGVPSVQFDTVGRLHAVHWGDDGDNGRLLYSIKSCLGY